MLLLYYVFLLLFSIFPIVISAETTKNNTKLTLYVGGSGSGNYSNIRSAIKNANNGDIIFVFSGEYNDHLIIDKKISLIGENRNKTRI